MMDDKILRKLFYVFLQNAGWKDSKKNSSSMYFYKEENIDFRFILQSICGWSI